MDTSPSFESPEAFYETLAQDNPDYLMCRSYGHTWRPLTVVEEGPKRKRYYTVTVECAQCAAQRVDLLDSHGGQVRSSYRYAAAYSATGSHGSMLGTRGLAKMTLVTETSVFSARATGEQQDADQQQEAPKRRGRRAAQGKKVVS